MDFTVSPGHWWDIVTQISIFGLHSGNQPVCHLLCWTWLCCMVLMEKKCCPLLYNGIDYWRSTSQKKERKKASLLFTRHPFFCKWFAISTQQWILEGQSTRNASWTLSQLFAKEEQILFCRWNKTDLDWTSPAHLICLSIYWEAERRRSNSYTCRCAWCCQCKRSIWVFKVNAPQTSCSVTIRVSRGCFPCFSPLCNFPGASQCGCSCLETLLQCMH